MKGVGDLCERGERSLLKGMETPLVLTSWGPLKWSVRILMECILVLNYI